MEASANEQKQRPLPPAGQHLALLYLIVDLGTQDGTFNGQPTAPVRKIYLGWEFPNLPKQIFSQEKGEQPMAIFNEYTFSFILGILSGNLSRNLSGTWGTFRKPFPGSFPGTLSGMPASLSGNLSGMPASFYDAFDFGLPSSLRMMLLLMLLLMLFIWLINRIILIINGII